MKAESFCGVPSWLILAFAILLAVNLQAQSPATISPADLPEAEFESLVDKTNLYVKALNAVRSAQHSYDRYTSWLDVRKGPTGKERYITYGLYEINSSDLDAVKQAAARGPKIKPAMPALDAVVLRMAEAFSALEPIVKRAHDYYEQEDFKDDAAKAGQELHARMMPLFGQTFAAETDLRRGLDAIKMQVDQRQLAKIEKVSGRKYEWHLRSYLLAAKALINLLPENAEAPPLEAAAYKARYTGLEESYNALQTFAADNPDEVRKVILASFVESAVKDFFTASKFLRRTLEASRLDRREYITRVGELAKAYNDLTQRTNSMR
ncbi:MAG: YiiG family protein [Chthoniobacterales bacterium]|nr:YiiG family protein [Chthoniobacterales bacterium]